MVKVIFLDMGGVIVKEAGADQIKLLAKASGLPPDKGKAIRKKYWSRLQRFLTRIIGRVQRIFQSCNRDC